MKWTITERLLVSDTNKNKFRKRFGEFTDGSRLLAGGLSLNGRITVEIGSESRKHTEIVSQ